MLSFDVYNKWCIYGGLFILRSIEKACFNYLFKKMESLRPIEKYLLFHSQSHPINNLIGQFYDMHSCFGSDEHFSFIHFVILRKRFFGKVCYS